MAPTASLDGDEMELADGDEDEDEEEEEAPTHLPLAPPSELEDVSTTVDPSYIISLIRQLVPQPRGASKVSDSQEIDENELSDIKEGQCDVSEDGQSVKDNWEDYGCILWDLSASINHAEFMVNNLLLDVLLANFHASMSFRVTEICLGIIGNLACHNALSETIVSKSGLVETVVGQLFLDDSTCLSETFRVLGVGLQGSGFASWASALLPEQVLQRILWIVGNTLNSILLERSVEFLLAIVENDEAAAVLLQPLTELDLPNQVVGLLSCETRKLRDENKPERSSILDLILRLVEALSAVDSYSQAFSSQGDLFHAVCCIVKSPDKIEMASSCISAVIIIANLLVDDQHLTSVLSQDFLFLQGLFDMFPFVSDDPQARKALWCILANLLAQVEGNDISKSTLHQFVSLFLDKFQLIKEDLEDHPMRDSVEDASLDANEKSHEMASSVSKFITFCLLALKLLRIASILEIWRIEKSTTDNEAGGCVDDVEVHRLLECLGKTLGWN